MLIEIGGRSLHVDARTARAAPGYLRAQLAAQPRIVRGWLAFLGLLLLAGGLSAIVSIPPGKTVFATSPAFEWGLLIAAYVFFVVTTSGLCLVASLGRVFGIARFIPLEKRHIVLAMLFLMSGFGIIALELHYPIRLVFGAVMSPSPSSAMWWMGTLYAFYLGVLTVELVSEFTGHERIHQVACTVAAGTAVVAPSTLGLVFGNLLSRPFWQGSLTPVYLLMTAILSGASVLAIVFVLVERLRLPGHGPEARHTLQGLWAILVVVLTVVTLYTGVRTFLAITTGSGAEHDAAVALMSGPLSLQSWVGRIGLGLLLPLGLLVVTRGRSLVAILVAASLAMSGLFADRLGFVEAGQIAPASVASGIVGQPYGSYSPSLIEIGIVLGAIGVIAFVFTLAERFLDLSSPGGLPDRAPEAADEVPEGAQLAPEAVP